MKHKPSDIAPPAAHARSQLSRGKKLVFAAITIVACLAALEGVLALVGVKPQLYDKDPYVGFSSTHPLFVEDRGPDGRVWLKTAPNRLEFFNPQQFPKRKGPGAYRIFSMGGSTTYGHPYSDPTSFNGWLREFLKAASPEHAWELINAGGISYGSYRVAQLMEELIKYQPDLFIIYTGHNEFLEKRIYGQVHRMPEPFRDAAGLAWRLRTAAMLDRAVEPLRQYLPKEAAAKTVLESEPVTLLDNSLGPTAYQRDDKQRQQVFQHYRFNLLRMVDIAQSVGARVIFVTPASNLREASPFKSEHRKDLPEDARRRWKALYDRARADYANPAPTNALAALAEAEEIDDRVANLYFVRGRVLEKLGRFEEAKTAYERARDEDVCPLRAPGEIRKILQEVANARAVPLLDYQEFMEEKSDHGITGASLFLDHVHPTVEGYRLLALELLKVMERESITPPNRDPAVIERTTSEVMARIDPKAQSLALMNLCKTMGWAGKREEAYRAGVRAAELGGGLAEVQYQAGLAAQLSGRTHEALAYYRRAIQLQPTHGEAHCALGVVLEDTGQWKEAHREFELAAQHGSAKNRARDQENLIRILGKVRGMAVKK